MNLTKTLCLCLLLLGAVLGMETFTDTDTILQNYFYIPTQREWLINTEAHKHLTVFFYDGLKRIVMIFAACCLLNMLLSIRCTKLRTTNHFCLMMLLSFIFVPVIVAGAKSFTNVYCPYQLDIYNGFYPFVRVLEHYPADFIQPKPGRCFPAGHATAGFAFMGLFCAFRRQSFRIAGLCAGLILGWTAGIYQMLRGQHFLSHTLFSMIASFMIVLLLCRLVQKIEHKFPNMLKC